MGSGSTQITKPLDPAAWTVDTAAAAAAVAGQWQVKHLVGHRLAKKQDTIPLLVW